MTQYIELFVKKYYIIILRKRKMELKSNSGWLSYIDISILL